MITRITVTCDTRTAYFRHGRVEERTQKFGRDSLRKETTLQTWAYTVRDLKENGGLKVWKRFAWRSSLANAAGDELTVSIKKNREYLNSSVAMRFQIMNLLHEPIRVVVISAEDAKSLFS